MTFGSEMLLLSSLHSTLVIVVSLLLLMALHLIQAPLYGVPQGSVLRPALL